MIRKRRRIVSARACMKRRQRNIFRYLGANKHKQNNAEQDEQKANYPSHIHARHSFPFSLFSLPKAALQQSAKTFPCLASSEGFFVPAVVTTIAKLLALAFHARQILSEGVANRRG